MLSYFKFKSISNWYSKNMEIAYFGENYMISSYMHTLYNVHIRLKILVSPRFIKSLNRNISF